MKIAGTAFFKVNGTQYSLRGTLTLGIGNVSRESAVGMDGYHGIIEKPETSFIEAELTDRPELDLNALEALGPVTVTAELLNGKTGVLRDAYQVNKLEMNAADGTLTVRFEGPRGEWMTA